MPMISNLPIMPKDTFTYSTRHSHPASDPYPMASSNIQRNAAIWGSADDEVLLQARASGLNWQPIADRYFPSKTANACRKRHERLIERRHVEDWDGHKLELLAQEYMACRKEMWEMLASRVGERWAIVEAKCMEKGLKTLQSTARMAQRKAMADTHSTASGNCPSEHASDSGIGLGSDNEMDLTHDDPAPSKSSSWHAPHIDIKPAHESEHARSRSLPQLLPLLPLYQPPPPIVRKPQRIDLTSEMTESPDTMTFPPRPRTSYARYSPDSNGRGGISIESVLAPADPQRG